MSNEAARTILSIASDLLQRANVLIQDKNQTFIFNYPLERCPDTILKKWLKDNEEELATLSAYIEVQRELAKREQLRIKIEVLK